MSNSLLGFLPNLGSLGENEYFEIFGIKLYWDDVIIICMLIFLYNEGVKDQLLFIALIMLLLS